MFKSLLPLCRQSRGAVQSFQIPPPGGQQHGRHLVFNSVPAISFVPNRQRSNMHNRTWKPFFQELNRRRKIVELNQKLKGEEVVNRRSSHAEWNYPAEIFAFGIRLGESFNVQVLTEAFVTTRYLEVEMQKQKDLGIENVRETQKSQDKLATSGHEFITRCLSVWLRSQLPAFPEEGIQALKDYLMEEEMLAEVSFHIGTRELILCEEYPPSRYHMAHTFKSVVGALLESSGEERAAQFIIDILGAQLIGKDLNDIWNLTNPLGLVEKILENSKMGPPESRLLWESGPNTLLSSYHVGIYSDQQLVGESAGETLDIAQEMAARDCLRRLFNTVDSRSPFRLTLDKDQLAASSATNTPAQSWNLQSDGYPINIIVNN